MRGSIGAGVRFELGAVVLGALVLIPCLVLVVTTGFDGLYGQDSFGYVNYATGPLVEALRAGRLAPHFFFPIGYPLLIGTAVLGGIDADTAALAISLISGAAVPVLVGIVARQVVPIADPRQRDVVSLLAGLIAALSGQLWQSSVVAMSDTLALACATAGVAAALRYARAPSLVWAALALALLTFAVETRLIYGAVFLTATAPLILGLARRPRPRAALDVMCGLAIILLICAPMLLSIVDAVARGAQAPFLGQATVHSWDPLNALRSEFETADGRLVYSMPVGLFYLAQPLAPYWFNALGLLVVPGVIAVVRSLSVERVAVLLLWPALVIGFLAGDAYQNTRFYLAAAPPIAILIAAGSWLVWGAMERRWPQRGGRLALLGLTVLLLADAFLAARFTSNFISRVSADNAAIRSIASALPADARVISLGATSLLAHDGFDAVELTSLDPEDASASLASNRANYLLVDPTLVHGQWAGFQPELGVDALSREYGLAEVTTAGGWVLYLVGRVAI